MLLLLQSSTRMAQYDALKDGWNGKVKIFACEGKNGQTKVCVCLCCECPRPIQCHVSVYLVQLSARLLRGTHSCKVATG